MQDRRVARAFPLRPSYGRPDERFGETDVKVKMKAALRAYILQRPVAAFKSLVMPLLPKDVRVDVSTQRVVVWRSFMDEVGTKTENEIEVPIPHR